MKRVSGAIALVILGAAGVAMAQQSAPPAGTMPSSQYPSSTAPSDTSSTSSTSSSSSMSSSDHAARKEQMKDCMAQQKASNSGMSKSDMKKYCKNQVQNSSSSSNPQQ
jgi:hypothetical protein